MKRSVRVAGLGLSLVLSFVFGLQPARAEVWELPPIVVERSPSEAWGFSGVEPVSETSLDPFRETAGRASGGIASEIRRLSSLPLEENGRPGTLAQSRGVGRSADELDVQLLGVSLNPAQGGGSDLSLFPAFLWSGFQQSTAMGSTSLDPRALGGTLGLTPWTEEQVRGGGASARLWRVHQLASGLGQVQAAVGFARPGTFAAQLGVLNGPAQGAAASLSWAPRGDAESTGRWRFHLLGVSQDVAKDGTDAFPTRGSRQKTARAIPVVQWDRSVGADGLLKFSAFADGQNLRVVSSGGAVQSDDQSRQVGAQGVWLGRSMRLLVGARQARFHGVDFQAPDETLARVRVVPELSESLGLRGQISRLEPELSWVSVTGMKPAWGGALGAKRDLSGGGSLSLRASSEPKLPSLLDRFATYVGYVGNPGLRPERAWSVSAIGDWSRNPRVWGLRVRALAQVRDDAQIASFPGTIENKGWARLQSGSVGFQRQWEPDAAPPFSLSGEGTWTHSRVDSAGVGFPLVPALSLRAALGVEPLGAKVPWELRLLCQAAGTRPSALSATAQELGGYALWDVQSLLRFGAVADSVGSRWALSASVENIGDRRVELLPFDPLPGRSVSVALTGEF